MNSAITHTEPLVTSGIMYAVLVCGGKGNWHVRSLVDGFSNKRFRSKKAASEYAGEIKRWIKC